MLGKLRSNKTLLTLAILAGLVVTAFALWAQIDLCIGRGQDWQGAYAAIDYDEPFYAAYLGSLIDGKARRNSPYSGAEDTVESPQKESYLSIQFLSALPVASLARAFRLSPSSAMILMTGLFGFLSGVAVFSLIYAITGDAPLSFAVTLVVLLGGAMAAGQGGIMAFISPESVHYESSLLFLRRLVPAASFPAMILFFVFVWRLLTVSGPSKKMRPVGSLSHVLFLQFTDTSITGRPPLRGSSAYLSFGLSFVRRISGPINITFLDSLWD